jgi:hypothetical protein
LTGTLLLTSAVGLVAVVAVAMAGIAIGFVLVNEDHRKREQHGD